MLLRSSSNWLLKIVLFYTLSLLNPVGLFAQVSSLDTSTYITLPASDKYNKNKLYRFLWGEHYRKEWHTPVTMKKVYLDTLEGGLKVYQTGGGRQTKSLRATDKNEREYVFRSVDKTFGKALPLIFDSSFLEYIANDQVTLAHPYAALIVAPLAKAADIFHATPALYFVPKQPALGNYNDSMGNLAYLFEQRPDENWSIAQNFGNSKKIVSTEKMLEAILDDNDNHVDENAMVRARLFDLFIGDGGRHEDQWRWATFKNGKQTLYKPIPRDRDNAFSVYDGFLLGRAIKLANAEHLQSFDYKIADMKRYNFPARNLDRHLMNGLNLGEWMAIAKDLQLLITDSVIEHAVRQMPPEVYPISGAILVSKLKSRRDLLPVFAEEYFNFIAKEVEITATKKHDRIDIDRRSDTSTEVSIYKITKAGEVKENPYYHRIFDNRQTKEIRIYGLAGNDQWHIKGDVNKSIKFRLIGGADEDTYVDSSSIVKNGRRTILYDDKKNSFTKGEETQIHYGKDSSIHRYQYDYYKPNISRRTPLLFFNNEDRIYVGYAYLFQKQQWRKTPYGAQHYIDAKYSIAQKAFSTTYQSTFKQLFGKTDLNIFANYDQLRWTNFFGLGNEIARTTNDQTFYRYRTREFIGKLGIQRFINNKQRFNVNATFNTLKIIKDNDRFLSKIPSVTEPQTYSTQKFYGAEAEYLLQHINDSTLPTKGYNFLVNINHTRNAEIASNVVTKYRAETNVFVPLSKKISLALKFGGTTLSGEPQFFQYNVLGNNNEVRGYQRNRFHGNSTVYNQNEIRFVSNVRGKLMNGKLGLFLMYDQGRVWLDGEQSNAIQSSYGAGIIISPFNFITLSAAYAVGKNDSNIAFRILKPL